MKRRTCIKFLLLGSTTLLLVVALMGCGGSGGSGGFGGSGGGSSVHAYLTDAPSSIYNHVWITIDSVKISTDKGWVTIPGAINGKIDVLSLQFQQQLIGSVPLDPGHYDQTRLILSAAPGACEVELADGTTHDLKVPSGAQTGIKLVGGFDVEAGQGTAILIDFDPAKLIHVTGSGQYMLRPTCPIITMANAPSAFGTLSGKVQPEAAWDSAVVVAYLPGTTTVVAAASVMLPEEGAAPLDTDGTFRLALPAGNYALKITATGYTPFDSKDVIPIPVTYTVITGADLDAGTFTLTTP